MIGVRRSHVGRGLGRKLLEAVHQMSDADDGSTGVSSTVLVKPLISSSIPLDLSSNVSGEI
jgi:hypothetical protein